MYVPTFSKGENLLFISSQLCFMGVLSTIRKDGLKKFILLLLYMMFFTCFDSQEGSKTGEEQIGVSLLQKPGYLR